MIKSDEAVFSINPAVAKLQWTPEVWQMVNFHNPNYANSLWLGTAWQVILLPTRALYEVILPIILGGMFRVAMVNAAFMVVSTCQMLVMGLAGRLRGLPISLPERLMGRIMGEREAAEAIMRGKGRLVNIEP
jgi:hypothetical protein